MESYLATQNRVYSTKSTLFEGDKVRIKGDKENYVSIEAETAPSGKYTEEHQQAMQAEINRKREKILESVSNREIALKRGLKAGEVLRLQQAQVDEFAQKPLQAKNKVLEKEKLRANYIASLPPPAKDPVDEILQRYKPVHVYDSECFVGSQFVPGSNTVKKATPYKQANARNEALRVENQEQIDRELKMKQSEDFEGKTNERFGAALKKEQLKNGYEDIMAELKEVEKANRIIAQEKLRKPLRPKVLYPDSDCVKNAREHTLEKAVEKILHDSNDDSNITMRRRNKGDKKELKSYRSHCDSPFPSKDTSQFFMDDDESFKKLLNVLRKEREETMQRIRLGTPSNTPVHCSPVKLGRNRKGSAFDELTNNIEATATPKAAPKRSNSVSVSTQTCFSSQIIVSSSSSHTTMSSSIFSDTITDKLTQTESLVALYQKHLLERAQKSGTPNLKPASYTSYFESVVPIKQAETPEIVQQEKKFPVELSQRLKTLAEKHIQEQENATTTPKFFPDLPKDHRSLRQIQFENQDNGIDQAKMSSRQLQFENQDNGKDQAEMSSDHFRFGNQDKGNQMQDVAKDQTTMSSRHFELQNQDNQKQMHDVPKDHRVLHFQNKENQKQETGSKPELIDLTSDNSKAESSESSISLSGSDKSKNSSLTLSGLSSSQDTSDTRIPTYIQHRVLTEQQRRGFPSGTIQTIEELRELLNALVPPGEQLEDYIRPKPPVSFPAWIQDSLIPHELSTIVEMDTPHTSINLGHAGSPSPRFATLGKDSESTVSSSTNTPTSSLSAFKQSCGSSVSSGSTGKKLKWAELLKKSNNNTPTSSTSISTVSSLSSGFLEAFLPNRIASQSTPIKNNRKSHNEPQDTTIDNIQSTDITLVGHEYSMEQPLESKSLVTLSSVNSKLTLTPNEVNRISSASIRTDSPLTDSMASFLMHEQSAISFNDPQDLKFLFPH